MRVSIERLREIINYDPDTGVVTWAKSRRSAPAGKVAGCLDKRCGYVSIRIDFKQYLMHRLIWFYVYGVFPEHQIDHIDGDKSNNRLANLREATISQNSQNRRRGQGRSKLLGAHWLGDVKRWRSSIGIAGKNFYLGIFDTPEEAHECYKNAKRKMHEFGTI